MEGTDPGYLVMGNRGMFSWGSCVGGGVAISHRLSISSMVESWRQTREVRWLYVSW